MNRIAAPLVALCAVALLALGAAPASAAPFPSGDDLYALSCPQENNPVFPDALQLWSVDATTATGAAIGSGSGDLEGLCAGQPAWDPVTKAAYAFALTDEHDEPSVLVRVDVATGASTIISSMFYDDEPVQVASLAIGLDGAAYALAYTQLYSIDLTTGELQPIGGSLPVSYGFSVDPTTGAFWALTDGSTLLEIDVATGAYTMGQSLELGGAYSLQIDSAGGLWVLTANQDDSFLRTELWSASFGATGPSTAAGILTITDAGQPFSQALLLVPGPPADAGDAPALAATGSEPSTLVGALAALLLAGGVLLIARRRAAHGNRARAQQ